MKRWFLLLILVISFVNIFQLYCNNSQVEFRSSNNPTKLVFNEKTNDLHEEALQEYPNQALNMIYPNEGWKWEGIISHISIVKEILIEDIDNDGSNELILVGISQTWYSHLWILKWDWYEEKLELEYECQLEEYPLGGDSRLARFALDFIDIDSDGQKEVIICTSHQICIITKQQQDYSLSVFDSLPNGMLIPGNNMRAYASGDFDGDGKYEIIVCGTSTDPIRTLHWDGEKFAKDNSPITLQSPINPWGEPDGVNQFFYGDVTHDNRPELVVYHEWTHILHFYQWSGTQYILTYNHSEPININAVVGKDCFSIADINLDGQNDLIFTDKSMTWKDNALQTIWEGNYLEGTIAGDANNNYTTDFVSVVGENLYCYEMTYQIFANGTESASFEVYSNPIVTRTITRHAIGDVLNNGLNQIVVCTTDGWIGIYLIMRTYNANDKSYLDISSLIFHEDVDNDGIPDLIELTSASEARVNIRHWNGSDFLTYYTFKLDDSNIASANLIAGDITNDGKTEILVYSKDPNYNKSWLLKWNPNLEEFNFLFNSTSNWLAATVGELNHDGLNELCWVEEDRLVIGNWDGATISEVYSLDLLTSSYVYDKTAHLCIGDYDNDGVSELICGSRANEFRSYSIQIIGWDGGKFDIEYAHNRWTAAQILVADFNLDGAQEVGMFILTDWNDEPEKPGYHIMKWNASESEFNIKQTLAISSQGGITPTWYNDFDNDVQPELLFLDFINTTLSIYELSNDVLMLSPLQSVIISHYATLAISDFDLDGLNEVFIYDMNPVGQIKQTLYNDLSPPKIYSPSTLSMYTLSSLTLEFKIKDWPVFNQTLAEVKVYLNETLKSTLFTGEFNYSIETGLYISGTVIELKIEAKDIYENTQIKKFYIIIDKTKPNMLTLDITDFNECNTELLLTGNVMDNAGIEKVEFYLNGTLIGATSEENHTFNYLWNFPAFYADGSYNITALAYDFVGLTIQVSHWIILDRTVPIINLQEPENGAELTSKFKIVGTIIDVSSSVTYEIYLNEILTFHGIGASFSIYMDPTTLPSGNYSLTVLAIDKAGNQGQETIWFNFNYVNITSGFELFLCSVPIALLIVFKKRNS